MADGDTQGNNPVSFAAVVPKSAKDQTVRNYLRLGDADSVYESKLENPSTCHSNATLATHPGALLYSTEQVSLVAPAIIQTAGAVTDWSDDKLSIVGKDGKFSSATWLAGSQTWPATTTFQRADDFNTTLGSITNAITGNTISQVLGNIANSSVGSSLRANYGHTQNVFSGQVVDIVNRSITVKGLGPRSIAPTHKVVASSSVSLAVSPTAAVAPWFTVLDKIAVWGSAVSAACQGGLNLANSIVTEAVGAATGSDVEDVKDAMKASLASVAAITSGVLILQAMVAAAGAVAAVSASAQATAAPTSMTLTPTSIYLRTLTATLTLGPAGLTVSGPSAKFVTPSMTFMAQASINVVSPRVSFA